MKFFNPYKNFVGSFIPNCLLQYRELSSSAKLLWARLAQYAGENGYCYPSQQTLADELGLSKQQILNLLQELEKKQFIYREVPKGKDRLFHKTTRYYFILHPIFQPDIIDSESQTDLIPGSQINLAPGGQINLTSGSQINLTPNNIAIERENNIAIEKESVVRESVEKRNLFINKKEEVEKVSLPNPTLSPSAPFLKKPSSPSSPPRSDKEKRPEISFTSPVAPSSPESLGSIINRAKEAYYKIAMSRTKEKFPNSKPLDNTNVKLSPSVEGNTALKEDQEEPISAQLDTLCEHLYREGIFPKAPAFKNTMLKQGKNKEAILLAFQKCQRHHPKEPWSYCSKIIGVENGNITERKHIEKAKKLKKEEKDFLDSL